jgi:hypothetical protein
MQKKISGFALHFFFNVGIFSRLFVFSLIYFTGIEINNYIYF